MKMTFLAAMVSVGALASPAFGKVIHKTTLNLNLAKGSIKCEVNENLSSYVNMGKLRTIISLPIASNGDLNWLPVMQHDEATLIKADITECPSEKDLLGEVAEDGSIPVSVTHTLQKISNPGYSNCRYERLDEKVEVKLKSGLVLTSRATHSLESNCNGLN